MGTFCAHLLIYHMSKYICFRWNSYIKLTSSTWNKHYCVYVCVRDGGGGRGRGRGWSQVRHQLYRFDHRFSISALNHIHNRFPTYRTNISTRQFSHCYNQISEQTLSSCRQHRIILKCVLKLKNRIKIRLNVCICYNNWQQGKCAGDNNLSTSE